MAVAPSLCIMAETFEKFTPLNLALSMCAFIHPIGSLPLFLTGRLRLEATLNPYVALAFMLLNPLTFITLPSPKESVVMVPVMYFVLPLMVKEKSALPYFVNSVPVKSSRL